MVSFQLGRLAGPTGELLIITDDNGLVCALDFHDYEERLHRLLRLYYGGVHLKIAPVPKNISRALDSYFAGQIDAILGLSWKTAGSVFQNQVWQALREIPAGETISYGQLAERIGRPKAVRAVGAANGANPIAIILPCHRVIGASGQLTGYGGGLWRKEWLLAHERKYL